MIDVALCLVDGFREAPEHAATCDRCVDRHRDALADVGRLYPRLSAVPGSAVGATDAPAPPGFESRSPARDEVLSLTDRRGSESVVTMLAGWHALAHQAGAAPRAYPLWGVHEYVHALTQRPALEWFARTLAAPGFVEDVRTARHRMLRVLGDLDPTVPVGACPIVVEASYCPADGSITESPCGGMIRARVYGETARCQQCRTTWEGLDEWRALGERLGDALLDAAGLARYLGVPVSTVRTWASRDGWHPQHNGRRRVYSLVEARLSYQRRKHAEGTPGDAA